MSSNIRRDRNPTTPRHDPRRNASEIRRDRFGNATTTISDKPPYLAFQPASEKFTLSSIDEPGDAFTVEAQFNPREFQLERATTWQQHQTTDKGNKKGAADGMHLEFGGAQPRSMSVELLFDGAEADGMMTNGWLVMNMIDTLEALATMRNSEAKEPEFRRPHLCVAVWGQDGMRPFRCVIESVSTKFQMFSSSGKVLRATCTVKLKEADILGILKSEAEAAKKKQSKR